MKLCLFDLLINDNFKDYEKSHIIIRSLFWSLGLVPDIKTDSLGLHIYYIQSFIQVNPIIDLGFTVKLSCLGRQH